MKVVLSLVSVLAVVVYGNTTNPVIFVLKVARVCAWVSETRKVRANEFRAVRLQRRQISPLPTSDHPPFDSPSITDSRQPRIPTPPPPSSPSPPPLRPHPTPPSPQHTNMPRVTMESSNITWEDCFVLAFVALIFTLDQFVRSCVCWADVVSFTQYAN